MTEKEFFYIVCFTLLLIDDMLKTRTIDRMEIHMEHLRQMIRRK